MAAEPRRQPQTPDEELLAVPAPGVAVSLEGDARRISRMRQELATGFTALADVQQAVSLFGSARTSPQDPYYALSRETAKRLGERGYAIITGGGGGIMEAANRGARDAQTLSIGLTIDLPRESQGNEWIDLRLHFHYFFTRKVMFVRYATAFVVFPGGFGTLDEMFECLTLIQTDKIRNFPVVLVGRDYWSPLVDWLRDRVAAEGKISPGDLGLFTFADDVDGICAIVEAAVATGISR